MRLLFATFALCASLAAQEAAQRPYFWFGMWPDVIAQYDPESDEVVKRIKLRHGLHWGKTLSHDESEFWVITDQRTKVEVVDLAKGEVVEVHDFAEENWIIRVSAVMEIPGGTHWYVHASRVERKLDHFVVKTSQYLLYDRVNKKVEKRLDELPKAIRRGARISPDGTMWHVFDGDLRVVDPKTNKEVGKVDLKTPRISGMGAISLFGDDFYDREDPDRYRMLYRMTDPIATRRRMFGVVDIDLKTMEVAKVEEWGASPDYWRIHMSQDKKTGVAQGRGRDDTTKLALIDLTNGKTIREAFEEFRPRRSLAAISPDGQKIYVGGAGNDFLIFDREFKRVKTVWLDADLLGGVTVIDG